MPPPIRITVSPYHHDQRQYVNIMLMIRHHSIQSHAVFHYINIGPVPAASKYDVMDLPRAQLPTITATSGVSWRIICCDRIVLHHMMSPESQPCFSKLPQKHVLAKGRREECADGASCGQALRAWVNSYRKTWTQYRPDHISHITHRTSLMTHHISHVTYRIFASRVWYVSSYVLMQRP